MSQVCPAIAGKRVGSIATSIVAFSLIARTYSKCGYCNSELPANSVSMIWAFATVVCKMKPTPTHRIITHLQNILFMPASSYSNSCDSYSLYRLLFLLPLLLKLHRPGSRLIGLCLRLRQSPFARQMSFFRRVFEHEVCKFAAQ